jgi:hypothetical protein
MKNRGVRGWFSYPVESQELLLDGATAVAAGAGLVYWGVSRFFYQPEGPLHYESGRYVKDIFDFQHKHAALLSGVRSRPQIGILVGDQRGAKFWPRPSTRAPRQSGTGRRRPRRRKR